MADGRRKLVITDADLAAPAGRPHPPSVPYAPPVGAPRYPSAGPQYPAAAALPYSMPNAAKLGLLNGQLTKGSTLTTSLLASVCAMAGGWLASELFTHPSVTSGDRVAQTALWTGVIGLVFGAVYTAWDDLVGQVWEAAGRNALLGAVAGAGVGAVSGAIAEVVFEKILTSALQSGSADSMKLRMAYVVAWAIFGAGIGVALGAVKRSSRKALNSTIGGTLGGAVGGFAFTYIGQTLPSAQGLARLLSLLVVGAAIGGGIGLVEVVRRQAWVRIASGGMRGKEFILYHDETTVGASPKAGITLIKDPLIAPMHFQISDHRESGRLLAAFAGCPVSVNGTAVHNHRLRDGDLIGIGSSQIQYQERAVG